MVDARQHLFEFGAGSVGLDLRGVADVYLENCSEEALEIRAKVAAYSRLNIKRLMKEDIRRKVLSVVGRGRNYRGRQPVPSV